MRARQMAGPEAASRKYDIITALGCHALGGRNVDQRLILRLITLLTARYNWRLAQLSVGQREIARLWSVDERTVKREMAKLRALGWLVQEAAARRGRVAVYTLDIEAIEQATSPAWARVGPDFEERMSGQGGASVQAPALANVVPFPQAADPEVGTGDEWAQAGSILRREQPAVFANWFASLRRDARDGDVLVLRAPSAFHANHVRTKYGDSLIRALRSIDPGVREVRFRF